MRGVVWLADICDMTYFSQSLFLARMEMVGQPVQFGLHQREELLQRYLGSSAPVVQQLGDLLLRGCGSRTAGGD